VQYPVAFWHSCSPNALISKCMWAPISLNPIELVIRRAFARNKINELSSERSAPSPAVERDIPVVPKNPHVFALSGAGGYFSGDLGGVGRGGGDGNWYSP